MTLTCGNCGELMELENYWGASSIWGHNNPDGVGCKTLVRVVLDDSDDKKGVK